MCWDAAGELGVLEAGELLWDEAPVGDKMKTNLLCKLLHLFDQYASDKYVPINRSKANLNNDDTINTLQRKYDPRQCVRYNGYIHSQTNE